MLCDQRASIGSGVDGAMAEYMKIPADLAFKLPPNVAGNDRMAIAEPAACAIRAVLEQSRVRVGDRVLVSGPGAIGQLTLWMAKLQGAFVIVSGTGEDEERLACAKALGADRVVSGAEALDKAVRETDGGVDVAFECAGAPASLYACVGALRKKGILSQVGLYGGPIRRLRSATQREDPPGTSCWASWRRESWMVWTGSSAGDFPSRIGRRRLPYWKKRRGSNTC